MFRFLRLRLTALYFIGSLLLVAGVAAAVYAILDNEFRRSVDLALEHRAALALHEAGESLPDWIARGEAEWYAERGEQPPAAATPSVGTAEDLPDEGEDPESETNPSLRETSAAGGTAGSEAEDESEADDSDSAGKNDGVIHPLVAATTEPTAEPFPVQGSVWQSEEPEYDAELSPIAVTAVRTDGGVESVSGASQPFFDAAAVEAALREGIVFRTVIDSGGHRVRVLSLRLSGVPGYVALQVSRSLEDQEHILGELVKSLLQWGILFAFLLAALSGWLSGRALQSAQQAWDKQQAFVAHAGHELRAPLTMIRAAAEVTQRKLPAGDPRRGPVDSILAEADRMGRLVGDLLLLSRLDARALRVELRPVDLRPMLSELALSFGRAAAERGVALRTGPGEGTVLADEGRLRQVLLILLDNALRHAPEGSRIEIDAGRSGRKIRMAVRDHGAGISAADLPHVFDRFYRGRAEKTDSGSGLGLAIAKELAEAMRGKIWIESAPDSGTAAIIELQSAEPSPRAGLPE